MTIQPGQEMIVGQTLRAVLGAAQKGKLRRENNCGNRFTTAENSNAKNASVGLLFLSAFAAHAQVRAVVPAGLPPIVFTHPV